MNENTRFEEYERKTRKIILTIGIIAGIFFLFGLLVISSDEENYNPEETSPDFVENQNILPDVSVDTEPVFIDTEDTPVSERKKPIKVTPAQINMNKFILGVDTQNQSVLTIGTDGSESIHIERVELVEETEDGFEFRDKCRNRDLRGDETCNVLITWVPHLPGNVQNNFKIIWYETRLDKSSARSQHKGKCGLSGGHAPELRCVNGVQHRWRRYRCPSLGNRAERRNYRLYRRGGKCA